MPISVELRQPVRVVLLLQGRSALVALSNRNS